MGTLTSRLIVSLRDNTGGGARSVMRNMAAMKAAATGASGAMGTTTQVLRRQARTMRAFRTMGGGQGHMAGLGVTAAAAGFLANEVNVQEAMNRTQAILNTTDEKFKEHKDLVVDLAKKYPTTSAEIAKGAAELAMSGMSLKQVNEVLEATVQGSMASGESIKTVGMGVTDVVMGLGKELTRSNFLEVNNTLAAGATSYAQDYSQFLAGLAKTAPLARVTGTSLKKVVGLLGMLANAGFKAEKGGTALRTMMINMGAPTPEAMKAFKQYGIELDKFRGKFDGKKLGGAKGAKTLVDMLFEGGLDGTEMQSRLETILSDQNLLGNRDKLQRALVGALTPLVGKDGPGAEILAETLNGFLAGGFSNLDVEGLFRALGESGAMNDIQALKAIFGKRFSAQASSIMAGMFTKVKDEATGQMVSVFDKSFNEFENRIPGAVKRFADILMKGLPGALKRMGGALDGLLRTMAGGEGGAMEAVADVFERITGALNRLSQTNPGVLKALTLSLLGLGVIAPVGFVLQGVAAAITFVGGAASIAATALLAMARGATFGLASLAVSSIIGSWTALAGAIGAARLQVRLMNMEVAAGNMSRLGAMAALIKPKWLGVAGVMRGVGAALRFAFIASGVGAVITAIAAAGLSIYNNWQGIKEFFSGVGEGFMSALGPAAPLFEGIASALGKIWGWFTDLTGPIDASKEQWRSWGQTVGEIIAWPIKKLGELYNLVTDNRLTRALGWSSGDDAKVDATKSALGVPSTGVALTAASAPSTSPATPPSLVAAPQVDATQMQAALDRLNATAQAIPGAVRQAMSQAKAIVDAIDLTSSGHKILQSLANGIRAAIPAVTSAMSSAAAEVKAHVPQSPAKKGPLRGLSGAGIITEIARTMDARPMVSAMHNAAAATRRAANDNGRFDVSGLQRRAAAGVVGMTAMAGLAAATPASIGDVHVQVHIPANVSDPRQIAEMTGREVRNAVRETFSDGGI